MKPGVAKVVCRGGKGSVTHPIREGGGEYSPINNSVKQALQIAEAINTATQQTIFLIRVELPGCYHSDDLTYVLLS